MLTIATVARVTLARMISNLCKVALFAALAIVASAQTSSTDGSTPLGIAPGAPAGSFALSDIDNVNLYNGNLNFQLPLLRIGGRGGAGYTMTLKLDSKGWRTRHDTSGPELDLYTATPNWWSGIEPGYGPGVLQARGAGFGSQQCVNPPQDNVFQQTLTRLTFTLPDGTEYELRDQLTNGQPMPVAILLCPSLGTLRGKVFSTADGSTVTFISDTDIRDDIYLMSGGFTYVLSGHLLLRDGTRYRIDNGNVTWMRDRNGNRLTFTYSFGRMASVTDSLNRQVTIAYGNPDVITYKGFGGADRTIRVWRASLQSSLRPNSGYAIQTYLQLFPQLNSASSTQHNPSVISSVELPDGRQYRLYYNPYGELARVELPTGGAIEYDYAPGVVSENLYNYITGTWMTSSLSGVTQGSNSQGGTEYEIYRRVVERRVYSDGVTLDTKMTYSRLGEFPNDGSIVMDQYNSSGALLARSKHYYDGNARHSLFQGATLYPSWKEGQETKTEALDTNGATVLLRTVNTWQQRAAVSWWTGPPDGAPSNDPRLVETVTTLADANLVSRQTFGYDQYNNRTDVYEYGFGVGAPGPLIRRTHTDHVTLNNGVDYATDNNIHIRNLPLRTQVFDASEIKRAETFYEYDNYNSVQFHAPLTDRPNISGHDGAFWAGYITRGNVTKTARALLDNSGGVTSWVNVHAQYDIAGNVVKAIDTKGNATQLDFRDNYGSPDNPTVRSGENPANNAPSELGGQMSYAFPFKITSALVEHKAYIKYDYSLGRAILSEDINNIKSNVYFNDALDRPTRSVRAIGTALASQTVFIYNDSGSPVNGNPARSITTISDKDVFGESNGGNGLKSVALYDGLGRTWRTAAYEDSIWSITDTEFDALSRVSQVSNPYRATDPGSASPPPGLWTKTVYDSLGRVVDMETPDEAHVITQYNGNQSTVIDPAGKSRSSTTDAAGRLVKVIEAPGVLNYETTYLYDVLGNLRKVTQGSQTRWFAYDSLSRLIFAKNPEQNTNSSLIYADPVTGGSGWSMAYSYDANGNLSQRIDARGVITSYFYDAVNRNTVTNYTNISQTRSVEMFYDGAENGKGRLHYERTKEGGVNSTETKINSYDELGRPRNKQQSFWRGSDWGTPFVIEQSYDLAGNVKTLRYPSDHIVNYSHDQAGRLSSFSGNLGGGASVNYADTISYNAAGQMLKEQFETNTPLYRNNHYNNRLQLVSTRLGDSETDALNWSRGRIDFLYGTTSVASENPFANDADNNGNLRRQINYVPLAGGGNVIPQQHDYTYDALNRIATVRERQRNASGQWLDSVSQAFSYDQWGNRTLDLSGGVVEEVWVDDAVPAGAVAEASGGDSWNWVSSSPAPQSGSVSHISNIADWSNWSPPPYSGSVSHQSNISSGFHQHQYFSSPAPIPVRSGGKLYAHIYIDPVNPPQQVMLQWGSTSEGWNHRAYWGDNIIGLGTPGTTSRKYMGPLPTAGGWVRLEAPASEVGLEGKYVNAMAFTLHGGRANWDLAGIEGVHVWTEEVCDIVCPPEPMQCYLQCTYIPHADPENFVLVDDAIPAGAASGGDGGDGWNWRGANNVELIHQHYFYNASNTLQVNAGDTLFTWVYLDPAKPPEELMLQWNENGSWEHRAYWGANNISWGVNETTSRRYMGPLPPAGGWVKLEIPASEVGLEGKVVHGMAFTLYGGRAAWDKAGKVGPHPLAGAGPPINNRVYTVDATTNRLQPPAGSGTMQYDAAGNLEIDPYTAGVSQQFVYDGENRMVEAYNGGLRVSWYVYDAEGKRVVRTVGSQTTWQIYGCGGELLAEYAAGASSSAPQKEYGYRNGQMLVVWDGSETGDKQLQWLAQDHLGSTRMVVDRSGNLPGIKRHDYAPFGEELSAGAAIRSESNGYSSDSVRQKFTGKERDETKLDYFLARYFSSVQGRFTSPDEFKGGPDELWVLGSGDPKQQALVYADITNPQSLNKYQYCFNNPLRYVDPDGHAPQDGGAGRAEERLTQAYIQGKISREEYEREREILFKAQAVGGLAGLAIVAAPKVAGALMLWAARNPQSAQQVVQELVQASSGNPTPATLGTPLTSAFNVSKETLLSGKLLIGLLGKAEVAAQFSKAGDTLVAGIGAVFNKDGASALKGSTLKALLNSVKGLARQEGLNKIELQAIAVVNEDLRKRLIADGWKLTKVKVLGQEVEAYTKTIELR